METPPPPKQGTPAVRSGAALVRSATEKPAREGEESSRKGFPPGGHVLPPVVAQQLDAKLLEGSMDVDEYAASLLRQVSLDSAIKHNEELKADLEKTRKELAELQVRFRELQVLGARAGATDDGAGAEPASLDEATVGHIISARFRTTSQLGQFVQSLVSAGQLQRDEDTDWYANTFASELQDLKSPGLEHRLAQAERARRDQEEAFAAYEQNLLAKLASASRMQEAATKECGRLLELWEHVSGTIANRKLRLRAFATWRTFAQSQVRHRTLLMRGIEVRNSIVLSSCFNAWRSLALDGAKVRFCQRRVRHALARLVLRSWAGLKRKRAIAPAELAEQMRGMAARQKIPALILAASKGMLDAVVALINEGNAVNMSERSTGNTPLHAAAQAASADICEVLLENGALPAGVNSQGETALHIAAKTGDAAVGVALALLRHGADPNSSAGRSPLYLAVEAGAKAMVTVLLQYGARIDAYQGRSPLHVAAHRADFDCVQALLAKHGKEPPLDTQGQTPLHAAASSDEDASRVVVLLVEHGFSPNQADRSGLTPLHIYSQSASATGEGLGLFGADLDLDRQDSHGNTPLHYACQLHRRSVALALVRAGASVYVVNLEEQTPLDLESQGFAVELLRSISQPPFLSRAERATRDLKNCQICKRPFAFNLFQRRLAESCRRCGRLCCHECAVDRVLLKWSSGHAAEKVPVKVCCHCSEILKTPLPVPVV